MRISAVPLPDRMSSFTFTETLRIAFAGVGRRGARRLGAFASLPNVRVVALCDSDERTLAAAADRVPGAATHHRFGEVLARDDVDAVVIATETRRHYEMAAAALESGRHVLVTPPLARTAAEAERLVALADERDRRLVAGHRLRYLPAVRHVEHLAAEGALGAIRTVDVVRAAPAHALGGESIFERLAPDALAVARALVPSAPVAVAAQGHAFRDDGAEDVVYATVMHADGELVHVHASRLAPFSVRCLTVVGSEATAVIDERAPDEAVRLYEGTTPPSLKPGDAPARAGGFMVPRLDAVDADREEARAFVGAVQERRVPHTDGADGLAVVRILDAARRSLRDGGTRVEL